MILLLKGREGELKYKLFFHKHHPETITLPAPSLFNFVGPYLVTWAAVQAYRNPAPAPEPEPQYEPPRQSVYSWDPEMAASGILITPPSTPGRVAVVLGTRPT